MITVPKMTLPPSSVIWNSRAATLSPPNCRAASIAAASRIAVMAMAPTTRDGLALAGMMPSARTLSSKPRLGSTVSINVLTQRPMRKAIASQTSAASTRGMASAMVLSIAVAGSEIAEICRICSAPMAAKMMIIADTVTPTARAIELRAGAAPSVGDAGLVDRQRRLRRC